MKRLRILVILLFVVSAAYSGFYFYRLERSRDETYPEIHFDSDTVEVSVQDGEDAWLRGVTAYDGKDGDITSSVMVESLSRFMEKGRRVITYAAIDSDGHVSRMSRELVYTDYVSPRFSISEPLRYSQRETADLLRGVQVTDCLDGDITYRVKAAVVGATGSGTVRSYEIEYSVSNSAGDLVTLPATIRLYDDTAADYVNVNLNQYIVYLKPGDTLNPDDYLKSYSIDNTEFEFGQTINPSAPPENQVRIDKSLVRVRSNVKNDTPGVYTVTYTLYTGMYFGAVDLIVVVEE